MKECPSSQVLFDYLQRELQSDQVVWIKAHLQRCAACRSRLHLQQQQIRQVKTALAQLDPAPGWPVLPLQGSTQLSSGSASFLRLPRLAAAFAAMVFIVAIIAVLMRPSGQSPVDPYGGNPIQTANRMAGEAYWPGDAQRDWDDQNVMIQVIDKQSQTVEVMRVSLLNGSVKRLQLTGAAGDSQ